MDREIQSQSGNGGCLALDTQKYLLVVRAVTASRKTTTEQLSQCPTPVSSVITHAHKLLQALLETWAPTKLGESLSSGSIGFEEDGNMSR